MSMLTTTQLATRLGVTKGRVSQYVKSGKLDGCYQGEGRSRRFDLAAVGKALGKRLDQGQMMGNGAGTRAAISSLEEAPQEPELAPVAPAQRRSVGASELPRGDEDRYNLARTQKAEEEARRLRRQNAQEAGQYVLASEASMQAKRQLAQEVAEFESVMRSASRRIADELDVDFNAARTILIESWRAHRGARAAQLQGRAEAAVLTDAEKDEDI